MVAGIRFLVGHACVISFLLSGDFVCRANDDLSKLDGNWKGILLRMESELPLTVHLQTTAGGLTGTIDLGGHLIGYPLTNLRAKPGSVHFEQTDINATFDGELREMELVGALRVFGGAFEVRLRQHREQPTFKLEDLEFANGPVMLSGSIVWPLTKGPYPAVVFTHPSGPVTRNELRHLAYHLARHGVASLIYDKRGVGASAPGESWGRASFDDLGKDALSGVRVLAGRSEIDAKRIGLFGHSQGGWIVARAVPRSTDVAFAVMSSGPAVSVVKVEDYRIEHQLRARGFDPADVQEALGFIRKKFTVGRTGEGWEELESLIAKTRDEKWFAYTDAPQSLERLRENWRRISSYDPVADLERITCPVLALYAELDTIVPVADSIQALRTAADKAGNKQLTIHIFPGADHDMFVAAAHEKWFWPHLANDYHETISAWITASGK